MPIPFWFCCTSVVLISGIKTNDRKYSALPLIHEGNIWVQRVFDIQIDEQYSCQEDLSLISLRSGKTHPLILV